MNAAIIIAGGSGKRTNMDIPKQFVHVGDKPIILYTMEAFQRHPLIDRIYVVCLDGWREVLSAYTRQFKITKFVRSVPGGTSRHESVRNGVRALEEDAVDFAPDDVVLIHDANRPMITSEIIGDSIAKAQAYGACVPVLPSYDWLLWTDDGESSVRSVPKGNVVRAQSPEAATFAKLMETYERAESLDAGRLSGLSSILLELGEPIHFSAGSERLSKITTAEDLEMVRLYFSEQKKANDA